MVEKAEQIKNLRPYFNFINITDSVIKFQRLNGNWFTLTVHYYRTIIIVSRRRSAQINIRTDVIC